VSNTQIQPGTYQRAAEALCLPEPYSDDDLDRAARLYEETHGIPLVRPGEEDENGHPNEKFAKRLAKFKFTPVAALAADPAVTKKELLSILEIAKRKGGVAHLSQREKLQLHECQEALGLQKTDFVKAARTPKQIADDAAEMFASVVASAESYQERIEAVQAINDRATLILFAENDASEDVREVAMRKVQDLEVAAIPEV
jgi:hypothetical protein